jgi:hypothetical protein
LTIIQHKLVTGYGATRILLVARGDGIFFQQLTPWITSFFAMSLALNIYCTGEYRREYLPPVN